MANNKELLFKRQFHFFVLQSICWTLSFLYFYLYNIGKHSIETSLFFSIFILVILAKNILSFKFFLRHLDFNILAIVLESFTILIWSLCYIIFTPYKLTGLIFNLFFIPVFIHLWVESEKMRIIVDSTILLLIAIGTQFFLGMNYSSLIFFMSFEVFVHIFVLLTYSSFSRGRIKYFTQLLKTTEKLPGIIMQLEITADQTIELKFVSQNIEDFTGYKQKDLIDSSTLEKILGKENWYKLKTDILYLSSEHNTYSLEFEDVRNSAWYRLYLTCIQQNRDYMIFNGLLTNIDELKTKEIAILEAKKLAEQAAEAKSNFLANMSHELRTPLNGVIGMTELMMTTDLDEEQKEYAETVKASGETLLSIINDVLDYSKLEAGRLKINSNRFSLESSILSVIDILKPSAVDKGLDIQLDIESDIPDEIIGDQSRVRQIMFNLIGNGIKFTQKGSILVKVVVEKIMDDQLFLKFVIRDTGIGIPESELPHIFEKFTQVDTSSSRIYGGTGLGLAISKELISVMGGNLEVESQLKSGSTFYFTLPFSHQATKDISQVVKKEPTYEHQKVLLVEDNDINQDVLFRIISKLNCTVSVVDDGYAAIDILEKENFDLVFMDCQMPGMDGLETTRLIRSKLRLNSTPIIALTGHAMPGDRDRFIQAGMDDYLCKPVKSSDLKSMIAKWSEKNREKT